MGHICNKNERAHQQSTKTIQRKNRKKGEDESQRKNTKQTEPIKKNRMLGPFLRYAVQRKGRRGMPTTLVDYTEQGARITDKPSDIKKKNVELTEEHVSK